ncbi:orotidine-5'-phosphate decarboxylase [Saprospiraceae bacterium]|nr:orotidine-5'-phosphate decarboxylase [Saprospiraceae bacterium]
MNRKCLFDSIKTKKSFLCVGLDSDINRIPKHLLKEDDPIFEFNKAIIDATKDLAIAYKPNTAFYEALGPHGMKSFHKTVNHIPDDILIIADAKRGDIGNTSRLYAKSFFEYYNVDAITVAPYMGSDSVKPFLEYNDKWVIILGLTSNEGSFDFQQLKLENGKYLYEEVLATAASYGHLDNIMFVVGATKSDYIHRIRQVVPDHFFLVPGIGAQGGNLQEVCRVGMNDKVGLIVNSSRSIIYASYGEDFAEQARVKAQELQQEMEQILSDKKVI